MNKKVYVLFTVFSLFFMSACGDQLLVNRTPLEADNYLRNNIETLDWSLFQQLVFAESTIEEKDFLQLQSIIHSYEETQYIMMEDEFYRFTKEGELLYLTQWSQLEDGTLALKELLFSETLN